MIVTIVRFSPNPEAEELTVEEARARFGTNAVDYLGVEGLLWKAYLLGDDGRTVGGTYWWADRASAEAKFNDQWLAGVTEKYGAPPTIEWFDAPVVVDPRFNMVRVTTPPTEATQSTAPPTEATQSTAPPTEATQSTAPPTEATQSTAPPTEATQSTAPPTEATQSTAPPTEG